MLIFPVDKIRHYCSGLYVVIMKIIKSHYVSNNFFLKINDFYLFRRILLASLSKDPCEFVSIVPHVFPID